MTKTKAIWAIAVSALILSSNGIAAQTSVNMAQITCAELLDSYVEDVVVIGSWMSGYYNAKRNNTTIDVKTLTANSKRVSEFCRANPKITVMEAIEKL